jgi:hypothetical protein
MLTALAACWYAAIRSLNWPCTTAKDGDSCNVARGPFERGAPCIRHTESIYAKSIGSDKIFSYISIFGQKYNGEIV